MTKLNPTELLDQIMLQILNLRYSTHFFLLSNCFAITKVFSNFDFVFLSIILLT